MLKIDEEVVLRLIRLQFTLLRVSLLYCVLLKGRFIWKTAEKLIILQRKQKC